MACGLPIETQVTGRVAPAITSGCSMQRSPAGPVIGISPRRSRGVPIATVTERTAPPPGASTSQTRRPAPASIASVFWAVAAHLGLAAVAVEHAHPRVGGGRRQDREHAVAADAELAIAQGDHVARRLDGLRVGRVGAAQVDHEEVVAQAVELGELHAGNLADPPGRAALASCGGIAAVNAARRSALPAPGDAMPP